MEMEPARDGYGGWGDLWLLGLLEVAGLGARLGDHDGGGCE